MAITRVNVAIVRKWGDAATATLQTAAASLTAGNTLIVAIGAQQIAAGSSVVTGVADTAGNTFTKVDRADTPADFSVELWYAKNVTGHASNQVTITFAGAVQYRGAVATQYAGLDPAAPFDASAKNAQASGSGITTGTLTTTVANEVHVLVARFGVTPTYPAGFSDLGGDLPYLQVQEKIVSATMSGTYSTSGGSFQTVILVGAFKEPTAPAEVDATIASDAPLAESVITVDVAEGVEATLVSDAPVPESIIRTSLQSVTVYAEVDLNDRQSYYGGYKAPLVLNFMGARRGVSDREGNLEHLQFGATLSDTGGQFRGLLASAENKYLLNRPITQRVITDAARRLEQEAWIVANGFIADYAPLAQRQFKIIGQDWLKKKFAKNVSAGAWQPVVRAEDFPNANNVYQQNIGRIIPIIYGRITDTRLAGSEPTTDYGDGQFVPIYGGDTVLLGETWAIGIIAAHHCDYLEAAFWLPGGLDGVDLETDPDWLTPRSGNWAAAGFTRPFQTINGRDYFVIYVKGEPGENLRKGEPVNNDQAITVNVWGRTNTGDETGTLLTNGFDIYEDFLLNYVCPDTPWVSGPRLPMPTFGPHVGSAPYVDLISIDVCKAVAEARLDGGYQLDFAVGALNETWSLSDMIAEFNKCLDCEGYINHYGAYALTMEPDSIDATAIIEVDEPLTDVHDIVAGGLTITDQTKDFWNVVPFRHTYDYCNRNQRHAWNSPWRSLHSGIHEVRHDPSVTHYEQERIAPPYEFHFIRGKNRDTDSEYYWQGTLMALDITSRLVARYANPRRRVQITTAFNGLQYDIGDIVPVTAQDGIGVTGWTDRRIRVTGHEVLATTGQVVLDGYDFDAVLEAADDWARLAKT